MQFIYAGMTMLTTHGHFPQIFTNNNKKTAHFNVKIEKFNNFYDKRENL